MFRIAAAAAVASLVFAGALQAREVTHAMGTTEVPDDPERVVILTNEGTEALLALGITPVGAVRSWTGDPWYDHIAGQMQDAEVVGTESGVNLELVAALEPDLIIGNRMRQEKVYDQLSAIAPTVMSEQLRGDWQINFDLYAEALGLEEEGEQVIADYRQHVADLSDALGEATDEEVSVVRFLPGQIRIYQLDSFSGVVLDQLGFERPENQDVDDFALRVGKESIPDMDGDRIFHFTYDTGDGEGAALAEEVLDDPLWQSLSAVQDGRVHAVDDAVWNTAGGVLAARLMLEDIARIYGVGH
ncbi:ABC transporter substrate-binding protein [Tranquillimonas alkanivorans]|uniref:Iron complex transport system substrate-binding protein n=1 Tax=Tranquillimonas alkanivorans TaxID=441119 RepID=A0A1I5WTE7_9RHOB|nr:iron-siderophore ABC transporter substrate-binding protein [Tranquillimonas alkanivorans]SFQ23042.1 iron complex transport system substrate-binding protein [Tranquillimonas alkanivorans]